MDFIVYLIILAGWGLPLYENEYEKGEDGIWRISRLSGPFTMYTNWEGWGKNALNNTWPDKFDPPPDLPPAPVQSPRSSAFEKSRTRNTAKPTLPLPSVPVCS